MRNREVALDIAKMLCADPTKWRRHPFIGWNLDAVQVKAPVKLEDYTEYVRLKENGFVHETNMSGEAALLQYGSRLAADSAQGNVDACDFFSFRQTQTKKPKFTQGNKDSILRILFF